MGTDISQLLPEYQSHKRVRAGKILSIHKNPLNMLTTLEVDTADTGINSVNITVDRRFILRHNPQIGDIYVAYNDGYASISPEGAFVDGYTRVQG